MPVPEFLVGSRRCGLHRAPAGWRCDACEEALCPRCAVRRTTGTTTVVGCTRCGGHASTLLVRRTLSSLADLAPALVRFPFTDGGRVFVVASIVLGGFRLMWLPGGALATALLAMYAFQVVRDSANGVDEVPGFADFEHAFDVLWAGVRAVMCLALAAVPWVAYGALRALVGLPSQWPPWTDPLGLAVIAAGLAWSALALAMAAVNTPVGTMLSPRQAWYAARGMGADLWIAVIPFWIALAAWVLVGRLADRITDATNVWVLPDAVLEPVRIFVAIVAARALGLLVWAHGDALNWGDERSWLDPALGSTQPDSEQVIVPSTHEEPKAEHVEPIDLPDEDAPFRGAELETFQPTDSAHAIVLDEPAAPTMARPAPTPRNASTDGDLMSEEAFAESVFGGGKR